MGWGSRFLGVVWRQPPLLCVCVCMRAHDASCVCDELPLGGQSCSVCPPGAVLCWCSQELRARPAFSSSPLLSRPGDGWQIYRLLSTHRCNSFNANPEGLISAGAPRS